MTFKNSMYNFDVQYTEKSMKNRKTYAIVDYQQTIFDTILFFFTLVSQQFWKN